MPAAAGPHSDSVSLDTELGTTFRDEQCQISNINMNYTIPQQQHVCSLHSQSHIELDSFSSFINTRPSDGYSRIYTATDSSSKVFAIALSQRTQAMQSEWHSCKSDNEAVSLESTTTVNDWELDSTGALRRTDLAQRLIPSETTETFSSLEIKTRESPRYGYRLRLHSSPSRLALSIFVILALLNGSTLASRDFYFPNFNQGNFAQELTHFHISWPSRVDHQGDFVTHQLHAKHDISNRQRRSPSQELFNSQIDFIPSKDNTPGFSHDQKHQDLQHNSGSVVRYKIPVHPDREVLVVLQNTHFLLGPSALLERKVSGFKNVSDSLFSRLDRHHGCHLSGSVKGDLNSKVALSACDGLRGFIQVDGEEYLIEPVKGHNKTEDGLHPHLVYRRSALPDHLDFLSRKKRKEPACGVTEEYDRAITHRARWERHKRSIFKARSRKESESHHSRKKRSISIEKHVETLIVVDPEMVQFYVNEDIETYVLTVMNMVATLFHDASIGNAVNIVIVRIMLLQDPDEELKITHHADKTLRSFCKWQKKINFRDDDHPNHHDVAVLMTRRNICTRMNEPCSTLGLAQVAGLCQPHRTCSINEDTGLSLAWTVAHELGHNFGMKHDVHGECKPGPDTQYVMAPHLTWDRTPRSWSNCSRTSITEFLDRNWGFCLDDTPGQHDFKYPTLPAGTMYDADHQCRLLYGEGAESCKGIEVLENICVTLWCRVNNKCSTKLQAAAVGTLCGPNKWCFNGQCVDIGERPQAIDGEWGEWGEWSDCTRTCGAGVSVAQRHCNHPPPSNGGKYCTGERKRYRICNTDNCEENSQSFRAAQCAEFNELPYKGINYEWEPLLTPDTPCQLHCKPKDRFFSVLLKDIVTDGTPCMIGSRHMCISGRCRHIGCDWILDSSATEDRCGVCFGDGSTCTTIKNRFNETKGLGYQEATVIPKGARNIRVEEVAEASNFLALRNDRGEYYLNGNWFIQWSGDYEVAGTVIHYKRIGNKEKFIAPGPLKEPLHIMLLMQTHNPGVEFEYTVPKENVSDIRKPEFYWDYTDWSHCTVSCGGGTQRQAVICKEKEAGAVHDIYCDHSTKPDDQLRACNIHLCPARWWAGPWQHCTVTCGDKGIHRRTVICVRSLGQDEQIALEDKVCEGLEKPLEVAPCNHKDPCPGLGSWQLLDWSNCTRSCDGGVQFRKVTCVGGTRCPLPKPVVERACNLHKCLELTNSVVPVSLTEGGQDLHVSNSIDSVLKPQDMTGPAYANANDNNGNIFLHKGDASEKIDLSIDNKDGNKVEGAAPTFTPYSSTKKPGSNDGDGDPGNGFTTQHSYLPDIGEGGDDINDKTGQGEVTTDKAERETTEYHHDIQEDRFVWKTMEWEKCSKSCDVGVKTRDVVCVLKHSGTEVESTKCELKTKPSSADECLEFPCLTWQAEDWSECSASCGVGVQNRGVICPTQGRCDASLRPATTRECPDQPACIAWVHGDWSKCSKSCGGGRQERLVQCVNLTSQLLVQGCKFDLMPEQGRECSTQDCPKDVEAALSQSCESNEMSFKVCRMLKRIGLCHKQYVQSKCCRTCADHKREKPKIKKLV